MLTRPKLADTAASFTSCTSGDIDTNTTCSTGNKTTGTLQYDSNGVWKVTASNSNNVNYLVAFKSRNGQKVGWIDFNDPTVFKYGQAVISEKKPITSGSGVDGKYFAMNTYGQSGELSLSTNSANSEVTAKSASGSINTATGNQPWDGFAKTPSDDGYGLMAGNGVYAYIKPNNYYFEIGVQK